MSKFTTRVELYGNPTYATYEDLHKAMALKGFSRQIKLTDGITYWLPNAEYTIENNQTTDQVLELAKQAAFTVWRDFGVMVTRTEVERKYHNLKKV